MKSIRNVTRFLALGVLAGVLLAARAEATPILSISPPSQNVANGDAVSVDILVSGLGANEAVGGVSFLLSFNDTVLQGTGFTLDPNAKMGFALDPINNDFGSDFAAGGTSPFEAFFLADASLDGAALKALQGSGFTLATVNFKAIASGVSLLDLAFEPIAGAFLSDAAGQELAAQAIGGIVCVDDPGRCAVAPTAVPEPATFGLLATGLAALARRRRKPQA